MRARSVVLGGIAAMRSIRLSSLESKISQIVSLSYVLVLKMLVGAILGGVIFRGPVHYAYLNTLNVFACTRESSVFVTNRRALGAVSGN